MPPVKLAVLGVGRWGVHLLRNFLAHPHAQVVAIADPNADRLTAVADDFQLAASIQRSIDWLQVLHTPNLEAVAIVTPASLHEALIEAALTQKLHVLAEKPLTLHPEAARRLCELSDRQQRQLVVDHTYLFHPAIQQGQQQIPQLGRLRYGYATRTHPAPIRQDVDVLWDLAIHDLSIFNFWLRSRPIRVQAQAQSWRSDRADLAWVKLEYPSGFGATLHLCWSNPDKQRRMGIVGDRGTLIFDELDSAVLRWLPSEGEVRASLDALSFAQTEPLWQVCDHFLACIQHNQPSPTSSGWVGAELVQILAALTASLQQDGAWVAIEDWQQAEVRKAE
ncbi:Gfo/Idh/MocA family oxidoreductase [Microcoleus sp. FACHB-1515]|uniref:Gfo/Idh/MocA family protein n=1 Tax=Cyanophyceae TaxID=3028117 RepID=UPI0016820080|nr:Gfo/Idh/MocA family oxidoreductase [Microcoleus sp. FACHB-1515]MBD2088769.1 Gfo/Idh/MocA family oxidoreductase [Microcoleus sp. FACHB-1515]